MSFLLVGTSKGLVVIDVEKTTLLISKVHFPGLPVSTVYCDPRNNRWWVSLGHRHWGEKLYRSDDLGKTWNPVDTPSYKGFDYRPGKPATLKKIWTIQQAGPDQPNALWLGTEPGGLFYSSDGRHFELNQGLWEHPSRQDENQWFGTGKDFPFIHSILIDPSDSNHIYVGISCAGVFESTDGGVNWAPRNKGLEAFYLPNASVEVGHDPHQMLLCRSHPEVIWQQNHCGIFRTIDGGANWKKVSPENGVPSYGFALVIDDENPERAWVIPAESDEARIPVDLSLKVYKTEDGGRSWEDQSQGLPQSNAFDLVLRHGLVKHQSLLAFGTNNGNLYWSTNMGESWKMAFNNLATISSIAIPNRP